MYHAGTTIGTIESKMNELHKNYSIFDLNYEIYEHIDKFNSQSTHVILYKKQQNRENFESNAVFTRAPARLCVCKRIKSLKIEKKVKSKMQNVRIHAKYDKSPIELCSYLE